MDLSSGAEIGRLDVHSPKEFMPENYEFVGAFHNNYTFTLGQYTRYNGTAQTLLDLLSRNPRPHGPGCTNCDHCGAAIAFVGVFQHKVTQHYIAVGQICAEKRFPMTNAQFQALRKAHRLGRAKDLAEAKFEAFKTEHPEVDWAAAAVSTNSTVRYIMSQGRKYGSFYQYNLDRLVAALATPAPVVAPAAPVAPVVPVSPEVAFLKAYSGTNSFLNSLKGQVEAGRTLSPKQLACVTNNIAQAQRVSDPAAQARAAANQTLVPGVYIASDDTIWKVQGNMAYKSGAKRAVALKQPFDPSTVSGARLYAKAWTSGAARLTLDGVNNLSANQGWEYVKGAIATLDIDHKMNVDEVKHFATITGQCVWCEKTLENTASYGTKFLELGIGPVCIKYIDATVKPREIDQVISS